MKDTRLIMGMPVTVEVVGSDSPDALEHAFEYFTEVDERFSTYKPESEISRFNRGELSDAELSDDMRAVFALAERTKEETDGYFDMHHPDGSIDPSGIVKSWAILNAANRMPTGASYCIDIGGDIASAGTNEEGRPWSIGIRNPFNRDEIVKAIVPNGKGVATSGSYIRGAHIYDPHEPERTLEEIVSLTVIGPDVLEADRFATAAFVMGRSGIEFIEARPELEG